MSATPAVPSPSSGPRRRVAIVGGTGYGGMELLLYLLDPPAVEVTAITSEPCSPKCAVNTPQPGPTSTPRAPGMSSAARAIARSMFSSTKKF